MRPGAVCDRAKPCSDDIGPLCAWIPQGWRVVESASGYSLDRPAEEHIEIPGASPRIIDDVLWERVQQIMNDPERIARRPKPRHDYPVRGRMRCRLCGSAMINRGHTYHHPVCRMACDRRLGRDVRADRLEPTIWREVRTKLTSPEIILQELRRVQPEPDRNAGPEDRALALEALQFTVRAEPTRSTVQRIVPFDPGL